MSFLIDYEFRPGCEYNCYLPRLQGAAAIPTLTNVKFRSACSPNCVHFWKPKPPPPTPPPPPVDPMDVYKYQYLKEKLAPFATHGPRSRVQTEYDQLMRNILKIGIGEEEKRKLKRDKGSKQNLQRQDSGTTLKASGKGGWPEEIENLATENKLIKKQMSLNERNHWDYVDAQYERINKLNDASVRLTQEYRKDLFNLCEKIKAREDVRQEKEEKMRLELETIEKENQLLEERILVLRQYPRIGNTRDQLKIIELEKSIKLQSDKTRHEMENPPFVAPEIKLPRFAPLPEPEETQILREMEKRANQHIAVLRKDVKNRSEENKLSKADLKLISRNPKTKLIEIEPENEEIPFLDIPYRRDIRI